MAKLGKALISIVQVKDGEPKPMYFQWSKSETVFAPKDSNLWLKGSSFIFFGGAMIGNIPYKSEWITDWTKVAAAKTNKYKYLWCKLTEDSEPFLFTGYSGLGGAFLLTVDRTDYVINKRMGSSATTIITLTVSEGTYSPDYLVWTLNGETITPTQVADDENVYKIAIPYSAAYTEAEIVVVPYADGAVISGVSASVILTGTDETDYYSFFGQVDSLPSTTSGTTYLRGDSVFLTTDNAIYTFNGSEWIEYASSALSDAEKVTILAKAQKTAFEYAAEHGLSQDYAYISTLITKYVYARAIGTELLKLEGEGKIIGGAQEIDDAGFLKALGVYIDSTGIARFTQALLNDCRIKGGTIEDIEITGELHNDVLWTNTKEEAGTEYSIGSVGSQLYYLGSEAKAKIKSLLASENTVYNYSGQYAGHTFTKLFKFASGGSLGYFNDNKFSTSEFVSAWYPVICAGRNLVATGKTAGGGACGYSYDGTTWVRSSVGLGQIAYCYGKFIGATSDSSWYISSDFQTWTSRGYGISVSDLYVIRIGKASQLLVTIYGTSSVIYGLNDSNNGAFQIASVGMNIHSPYYKFGGVIWGDGNLWQFCYYGNILGVGEDASKNYKVLYRSGSACVWGTINVPSGAQWETLGLYNGYFVILVRNSSTLYLYAASASSYYNGNASTLSWSCVYTFANYFNSYGYLESQQQGNLVVVYLSKDSTWYHCVSAEDDFTKFIEFGVTGTSRSTGWRPKVLWVDYDIIYIVTHPQTSSGDQKSSKTVKIVRTYRGWQVGINFLNSDGDVVCYESALDDYMQSQSLTLNNGSTALLNLPSVIPSDMNTYRRIPTLFDTTAIFRSLQSVTVAEYTIFDPSINAERVISAVSSAIKVSISPDSFKVDDVEKANSTWYIKNATAIVVKFTPLALAAGVETGSMNPKDGLENVTLGAIRPYKAVRAEQVQADKFEGVYPIGSVYISSSSTDPTTYFGGTWALVTSSLSLGGITLYMFKRTG